MEDETLELPLSVLAALDAGTPAVQAFRKWRGYGVTALALASGVPASALSEYEAGRHELTLHEVELLAGALSVPGELLLKVQKRATPF